MDEFEQADEAAENGEMERAIELYEYVCEHSEDGEEVADAHEEAGTLLVALLQPGGDARRAVEHLVAAARAGESGSEDAMRLFSMAAAAHVTGGRIDAALEVYDEAIAELEGVGEGKELEVLLARSARVGLVLRGEGEAGEVAEEYARLVDALFPAWETHPGAQATLANYAGLASRAEPGSDLAGKGRGLWERLVEVRARVLGWEHPKTVEAAIGGGEACFLSGELEAGCDLLAPVLAAPLGKGAMALLVSPPNRVLGLFFAPQCDGRVGEVIPFLEQALEFARQARDVPGAVVFQTMLVVALGRVGDRDRVGEEVAVLEGMVSDAEAEGGRLAEIRGLDLSFVGVPDLCEDTLKGLAL